MPDEAYCPNCGAYLDSQPGFDPDDDMWKCAQCGERLFHPGSADGEAFEGIFWVCDNCGATLNRQSGFSDANAVWQCTACGYRNKISEEKILDDREEWDQAFTPGSAAECQDTAGHQDSDGNAGHIDGKNDSAQDRETEIPLSAAEVRQLADALRDLNDEIERKNRREARERRQAFLRNHWAFIVLAICLCVLLIAGCCASLAFK